MTKREEMWSKVHELSCTHQYIRADECTICWTEFAKIIEEACKESEQER